MRYFFLISLLALGATTNAIAEQGSHGHHSPYAGEQTRDIAALSAKDLEQLKAGAGWGLARAAELNGVPGPMHLLEMKGELGLEERQIVALTAVRDEMRQEAIKAGEAFISAERALDNAFTDNVPNQETLEALVRDIGEALAQLRLVHLKAHLETPTILTEQQIEKYNVLRGYGADPCASVPEGHNKEMWRRHNGCSE